MKTKTQVAETILEETLRIQVENPLLDVTTILDSAQEVYGASIFFDDEEDRRYLELAIEYGAMAIYRAKVLKTIADLGLDVYGDE